MNTTEYKVVTPEGVFLATWEGEEGKVSYSGSENAILLFKSYMDLEFIIGDDGIRLNPSDIDPDELYRFCQSDEYGIFVIPSIEDLAELANESASMNVFDSSSGDDVDVFSLIGEGAQILSRLNEDSASFFDDISRLRDILQALGAGKEDQTPNNEEDQGDSLSVEEQAKAIDAETGFGLKRSGIKTREEINAKVRDIVAQINAGRDQNTLTKQELDLLSQYSGRGGLSENSQYEYFTPQYVAEGIWDSLKANGFANGSVLEPSVGAGAFVAAKPKSSGVKVLGTEIDPTSSAVAKIMHPQDDILNQSFEKLAVSVPDNHFDAVIGNVPFGNARGASAADDPAYRSEKQIERYFVNRVIDKTRPGGLIALVVPIGVIGGKSSAWQKFRAEISRKAEFLGGHKLPSKTFGKQGTDVVTDIIVLRKHPADLLEKIESLPTDTLQSANVLWQEFIQGKYWQGEGKRFIHGQYVAPDKTKVRAMEQVIAEDGSTPESLKQKLAAKFDSRIDWGMIESAEPTVNAYVNGDVRIINGKQYRLDGGAWAEVDYVKEVNAIDAGKYGASSIEELRSILESPESMLQINATQASLALADYPNLFSQQQRMAVFFAQSQPNEKLREQAYRGSLIGSMVAKVVYDQNNGGADEAMRVKVKGIVEQEYATYGHPRSVNGFYLDGDAGRYFGNYLSSIDEAGNVSNALSGNVKTAMGYDPSSPLSIVEFLTSTRQDSIISLEAFKSAYKGERKIETLGDIADIQGIAFTTSGFISTTKMYCAGDIYQKSAEIMLAMAEEKDQRVKDKFQSQIDLMFKKARRDQIENITFGLRDRWIDPRYKFAFFKQAGYNVKYLVRAEKTDSETGKIFEGRVNDPESTNPDGDWVFDTGYRSINADFVRRLGYYMEGKSIGHNVRDKQGEESQDRIDRFREQIESLEDSFQAFMQSHPDFLEIENKYNRTFNDYVAPEYETSDLGLKGVAPTVKTHWYQNQAVRQLSDQGSGILGFDVGLGKTYSALAFSVFDRQMGRSNKHLFVVPNSVLPNWYMESKKFLGNHHDVMFVGFTPKTGKDGSVLTEVVLDENGNPKKNQYTGDLEYQDVLVKDSPETVFEKMHAIPQSSVGIVVMTYEKYATIPMRDENRISYADKWVSRSMMSNADAENIKKSYADAKKEDALKGQFSDGGTKKKAELPFFEDMGFDRIIVDEGHSYKNSFTLGGDTQNLAYLPNPISSQRGRDMAMKAEWMREKFNGKGTILLTATPVTNSPIEIFNMLNLAVGTKEFEQRGVSSPDDFVRKFGKIGDVEKVSVSGEVVTREGLQGFKSLNALRGLFHRSAIMKNAQDVDPNGDVLKLPDAVKMIEQVSMSNAQDSLYVELRQEAKAAAKKDKNARPLFAIIRDMDRVTTDLDLYNRTVTFVFKREEEGAVKHMIQSLPASITTKIGEDEDGEKVKLVVKKTTDYTIDGDTILYPANEAYEDAVVAEINRTPGITYISHPLMPKYASLIKNMQGELDSNGKQIVFTEEKSQHQKIKRLLINNLGIDSSKIAIINADTAAGENMQKISDAFNRGDVRIVIANKKAEVGVNLQKGTTAIHHLTLPWNPASIQQRNGRGVRQGNTAKEVKVYYYQAMGSFDEYRLDLLTAKGGWISDLMNQSSDVDYSDNNEAMGVFEQAALLSDNKEEFLQKMAEQKAIKDAEAKEKRDKTARIKLNQVIMASDKINNFESDKSKALENAQADIDREVSLLEKFKAKVASGEASHLSKEEIDNSIGKREIRINNLRKKLEELPASLEKSLSENRSLRDQNIMFLRGIAKKGELPFDSSVLDAPSGSMFVNSLLVSIGSYYRLQGRDVSIIRVTALNRNARTVDVEGIIGMSGGNYRVDSLFENASVVNYTEDEISEMKLLSQHFDYIGLKTLKKEFFLKHLGEFKINFGYFAVEKDGNITVEPISSSSILTKSIVYPERENQALVKAMVDLYARLDGKNTHRVSNVFYAIFGEAWESEIKSMLVNAPEDALNQKVIEAVNTKIIDAWSGFADPNQIVYRLSYPGRYYEESASSITAYVKEWMLANGYQNTMDIPGVFSKVAATMLPFWEKKRDDELAEKKAKADEEAKAKAEALKQVEGYREVPQDIVNALKANGINIFYNTAPVQTVANGRFPSKKYKPFERLWVTTVRYSVETKDVLKLKLRATFCKNASDGTSQYYANAWHMPSDDVTPEEVMKYLGH